ncbi:hypothetical protein GGU10DRAFT_266564 [Lentinula aff. detonsa]|uniref:Uncharacterized protein n=1 Tax=Lentinula aff. detonsa TaxID=2804958 RepID=A0AA38KFJ3_9AGAR|nr:hypothetical protein GGU10DRAFT_266564 [Lentinula aff. detonsa]
MDFLQGLDPSKLALFGAGFSFFLSGFSAPPYNLPIFLFGIYAQENADSAFLSLQTFTGLLGASVFYDIVWMANNEQGGFTKFLSILLLLVKIPTFLAFGLAARQRGVQFSGLGIRGNDISGPTGALARHVALTLKITSRLLSLGNARRILEYSGIPKC